jgi:hypothetical protein
VPQKIHRQPASARRAAVRVKWCGKSAPRRRQRRRQGKPHREQDQVGAAGISERSEMPGGPSRRRSGRSHEALGDERPRGMVITAQGYAPRAGQNPAYTPSGPVAVDPSAHETGISALCRGQPCGWRILSLLIEIDRLAWPCVVDAQGFALVPGSKGLEWVSAKRRATRAGGRCGRSSGSPVPFWSNTRAVTRKPPNLRPRSGSSSALEQSVNAQFRWMPIIL